MTFPNILHADKPTEARNPTQWSRSDVYIKHGFLKKECFILLPLSPVNLNLDLEKYK